MQRARPAAATPEDPQANYQSRLLTEREIYTNCPDIQALPPVFHYWADRHIRPKLEQFGFSSPTGMFKKYLEGVCERLRNTSQTFISIGSGNGQLEIELAGYLRERGHTRFLIECLDINSEMLSRARHAAAVAGVAEHLRLVQGDFNKWTPEREYDVVMANQSLHHVVNLEGLFSRIEESLRPEGLFLASDMIGRNGHQRWPEALEIVHEFWRKLPPSYRYNHNFKRYEELYENWDCSAEGFEGIRSQDILPLLLEIFHFRLFAGFGNVINPFVDRVFGGNFNREAAWDRSFIDQVHRRDEEELASGRLTPTHMVAVLSKKRGGTPAFVGGRRPEACVRLPDRYDSVEAGNSGRNAYEWQGSSCEIARELELACTRLREAHHQAKERIAWTRRLEEEMEERTAWALRLDRELKERIACIHRLDEELKEQTGWALRLDREIKEAAARELSLQQEISGYVHNPLLFGVRLLIGVRNRAKRLLARWTRASTAVNAQLQLQVDESVSGPIGVNDLGGE